MPMPSELSDLLFHADPMGTCCRENDAVDEYDRIAHDLAVRLENGETLDVALYEVLREGFGDELVTGADLSGVLEALGASGRRTGGSP